MRLYTFYFIGLVCTSLLIFTSFYAPKRAVSTPVFMAEDHKWADSVLNALTLEEKIGQLFMVAAYSNKGKEHESEISELVKKHHIGGVIFFQGGPVRQARLTNKYQQEAKVPLLVAMDAEWGLGMRLDSTISYPRQMMLGAINNNELLYQMGADIALQCKRLGVHINFAPVVDVNVNPKNPVINSRSFGENKENVAEKSLAYMKGMQDNQVLAVAKHFPGHGDTDKDSHKALPLISHNQNRLHDIELYPFKTLFDSGCGGVMVAHLLVPALDSTPNRATTLSPKVVTELLQQKLGFSGLIFTDALNMKGVSNYYKPGEADLLALKAGNDVLLFPKNVPLAIDMIKQAIDNEEISVAVFNEHVRKILQTKYWAGLNKLQPVDEQHVIEDLNTSKFKRNYRNLIANSITLVKNEQKLIPFSDLKKQKIVCVTIGATGTNYFVNKMKSYTEVAHVNVSSTPTEQEIRNTIEHISSFSEVVVTFQSPSRSPSKHFGVSGGAQKLLEKIAQEKSTTLVSFCNPYVFNWVKESAHCKAVIVAYNNHVTTQEITAQVLFGGVSAAATLPVSAGEFTAGQGFFTPVIRFSYAHPEDVNLDPTILKNIDSIAENAIDKGATPGCQIVIVKDEKVVWNKAYGYHSYDKKKAVSVQDIYDLASITKVVATLPAIMKMDDEGKIDLDSNLLYYLPELVAGTAYEQVTLREMLAHQAGLKSWIPFYLHTLENGVPRYDIYSLDQSKSYPVQVAENMYIRKTYKDTMLKTIVQTPLDEPGEYRYSDLGYYFLQAIIEKMSGQSLATYVAENFYEPLGMTSTGYHPLERFSKEEIIPTENDQYFRKQLIHGYVHDPGAAMMGGVGGHAGVFSNALDLAKIWQMYLNKGSYGGKKYITSETIAAYTDCQFCINDTEGNRRAVGFDKPVRGSEGGPTCNCVSYASYGHTGFTGTISWADPENNLIYIFLSNRINPSAENKKLITMNVRTDIMQVIYNSMIDSSNPTLAVKP